MFIKQLSGAEAIRRVKKFVDKYDREIDTNLDCVTGWYTVNKDENVYAFILYERALEESAASVVLISKCQFDPLNQQKKPHVLDFVYTARSKRNKGYGTKIVARAQENFQFTVFCKNDAYKLFEKLKCIKSNTLSDSTGLEVYRWDM